MSTTFPQFAAMHGRLFDEFAESASYVRDAGVPVTIRLIVDDGVQTVGTRGEVLSNKRVVSSIKSEYDARRGDEITVRGSTRKIATIEVDDGYMVQAVLHG